MKRDGSRRPASDDVALLRTVLSVLPLAVTITFLTAFTLHILAFSPLRVLVRLSPARFVLWLLLIVRHQR